MNDRFNTIAGWVLGGGIVLLGGTLVAGEMFKHEAGTKGYPIEGVVEEGKAGGGEPEQPIAALLATADAARGANSFKKCTACHTINQGGANGIGPNLWGVMGGPHGHNPAFSYSDALKSHAGPWNWDEMNAWLRRPSTYAPGTKMTFAGISDAQERADLILYLNSQGSNLPLPAPPAAGEAPATAPGAEAGANASTNSATPGAAPDTPAGNQAEGALKGGGDAHPAATNPGGH